MTSKIQILIYLISEKLTDVYFPLTATITFMEIFVNYFLKQNKYYWFISQACSQHGLDGR